MIIRFFFLILYKFIDRFLGEDLMSKERKKAQIEQQRAWLQQQVINL